MSKITACGFEITVLSEGTFSIELIRAVGDFDVVIDRSRVLLEIIFSFSNGELLLLTDMSASFFQPFR